MDSKEHPESVWGPYRCLRRYSTLPFREGARFLFRLRGAPLRCAPAYGSAERTICLFTRHLPLRRTLRASGRAGLLPAVPGGTEHTPAEPLDSTAYIDSMTRTLLALWGTANSGKSTTIRRVYELLKSRHKGAKIIYSKFRRDFTVILLIKGRKVGIESQGDPNSRLGGSLQLFVKEKCNVIICATRTRGQTVDAVNTLKKQYEIVWFQQVKSLPPKHQAANNAMARQIVRAAEKAIK